MPSPFPGMDPYIEECGLWEDFHGSLIHEIKITLARAAPGHNPPNIDRTFVRCDGGGAVMQLRCELAANQHHEHRVIHPREQDDHAADQAVGWVRREVIDVQSEEQRCQKKKAHELFDPQHPGTGLR